MLIAKAKYNVGQVVRHKNFPFRGVVFDVDAEFGNSEEWWAAIPKKIRPKKEQPYYHLLAENDDSYYVAYVSEQNLILDDSGKPVGHPEVHAMFNQMRDGKYDLETRLH